VFKQSNDKVIGHTVSQPLGWDLMRSPSKAPTPVWKQAKWKILKPKVLKIPSVRGPSGPLASPATFHVAGEALKKYGHDNFSLHIVEYTEKEKNKVLDREQYYLDMLRPYYNILEKAGSSQGFLHTEETKQLLSKIKKGLYEGENNPFYGKIHTEETKQSIKDYQLLREDHPFAKIGESSVNYGRKHSLETNLILSDKLSGSNNPAHGHTYSTPAKKVKVFLAEDNSLF